MSTEDQDKPVVQTAEQNQEAAQQQEEQEARPTPELSPRERAMAEIAAEAARRRDAEAAERIDGMEAPPAPTGEEPAAAPAVETEPGGEVEVGTEIADPDVEIVVNGQKMTVKQSQIVEAGRATLQKERAADFKLEMASKLLKDAEAIAQGKQPSAPADAQMPAREAAPVQEKSDAELAKQIQYGTEEQAAEAIREIRRRDAGAVTPESLKAMIAESLPSAVGAQLAFHNAASKARETYSDIFGDPYLTTLFHVQEHRARESGDSRPHAELYTEIGENIRKHFKLKAPTPSSGPSLAEKRDAKASAPSLPRTAAVRVDKETAPPKTREEVRDDVLTKMAKSRGQRIS